MDISPLLFMSVFLALVFMFLYRNLFSTISATLHRIDSLRILTDWKRKEKRVIIRGKERRERKKREKGNILPQISIFQKSIEHLHSHATGIPSVSHPPPIPKPGNNPGDFLPQAVECYLSSKSNIQNFPTTIVFSNDSR